MAKTHTKPAIKHSVVKQKSPTNKPNFFSFLKAKEQWLLWGILVGIFVTAIVFLKIYYPYPQTETDSGNYILSAANGKINGYRPYGYSAFLAFFHTFSSSIQFVVTWQWLIHFIAVAFFLFSVKYIFRGLPAGWFYWLCLLCCLNPSALFLDAYLMSDGLFVNLTLLFLTTGLWLLFNGGLIAALAHMLLLWWCMDVRYIGLFYPFFSAAFLAIAFWKKWKYAAVAMAALPVLLLLLYRSSTTQKMSEEFGVETFSAFGGWQKANNAVAVLPFVKVDTSKITDPMQKFIHQIVRSFPDSFFSTSKIMATDFMWTRTDPGKQCLFQYIQQTGTPYMKAWAYMGTQMQTYGDFLESNYRSEFLQHFVLQNFKNTFKVFDIGEYSSFVADANTKAFFSVEQDSYSYKYAFFRPLTGVRQIADSLLWVLFGLSLPVSLILWPKSSVATHHKIMLLAAQMFVLAFVAASSYAAPINNFRYMMPIYYMQVAAPIWALHLFLKSKTT